MSNYVPPWLSFLIQVTYSGCINLTCILTGSVLFNVKHLKVNSIEEFNKLTEEMKLDAVVVTVALAEEEQCLRALEKKVHMTALQVNSRPTHSSRRGMWSCKNTQVNKISTEWTKTKHSIQQILVIFILSFKHPKVLFTFVNFTFAWKLFHTDREVLH